MMLLMSKILMTVLFYSFLSLQFRPSIAQNNWIQVGYYDCSTSLFPVPDNSALFTHMVCAYAGVNSTSYHLSLPPDNKSGFATFTETVKQRNPSVVTLLSIGGTSGNYTTFASMVSDPSYRKSFIDSSIQIARRYSFQGLDLRWELTKDPELSNMSLLFEEWRAAISLEATNSTQEQLILTAAAKFLPNTSSPTSLIESMQKFLDWVHVETANYHTPENDNVTGAPAALYDPSNTYDCTDCIIRKWIDGGLSASKLVLYLPFFGYAWTLLDPQDNGIGAPATGAAINKPSGFMSYKEIKNYIERLDPKVRVAYNGTYAVNYISIGTSWIGYEDVEAIRAKVLYAKEKKLLGYHVWQVALDVNWTLAQAAANSSVDENLIKKGQNKRHLLVIVLSTTATVIFLTVIMAIYYCWRRNLTLRGMVDRVKHSRSKAQAETGIGDFGCSVPNLTEYTLNEIDAATNYFSTQNKLGQGGYGPVYKGILANGHEIAVKKLSKTSTQGFEEFKNEVVLTAKLQHINLVRVLGYCIDKEEHMLIYEYMKNKSLDYYLFDPNRSYILDWKRRVQIIEGVTQGLLYLQEYSRFTIIHRDLKSSNVLLDEDMKSKISDFGMARIFVKDDVEAYTKTIVGTLGYVPPEYLSKGIYSTKSDVYSFGILLLEIISGKSVVSNFCFQNRNLNLLEYAYGLWKDGRGMEFMHPSLDDTCSSCKLTRCLHIALLCAQENPDDRPSMLDVFIMLKNETKDIILIPDKPGVWKQNDGCKPNNAALELEICAGGSSVNDATISEVIAR